MELPEVIQEAINQLTKIPGVGQKTATRQVLALSNWNTSDLMLFGEAFKNLTALKRCKQCGLFSDHEICHICSDTTRNSNGIICVVENLTDCLAIENSGTFTGTYHILGGVLNPLLGIGPDELKIDQLVNRIHSSKIKDVILAINTSVEGDATCSYLKQQLNDEINVERIGFGIPIGGSLEYLDSMTISKALENRKRM